MPNWKQIHESMGLRWNDRTLSACYGVSEETCNVVWNKLNSYYPHVFTEKHLLWMLAYLKEYSTYDSMASKFRVSTRNYFDTIKDMTDALYECLNFVILFYFILCYLFILFYYNFF